ncbi:SagB family peptide dehydrogenase [Pseudomonas sp. 21TX0197]|jgi:SagB-type dehydrogenase family enzyme|uniref:SagB family peptide dehydrogenase n=1 Tax=unclassified Pseudomonas TaxID=196821 RepID=UPI0009107F68|nr:MULTISPECIES: SagB family peptide dehydrogenase [unclassified Pseudomonas]MDB6442145.1 SagB family peptide dehydrogenase [Pseudomonas sp. 21TX0197]ROO42048.1 dehydrogenase [Pseudomonas sp. 7SR1]SFX35496.1 SagB-type dehydrogenase domain-containing protein [Pseudomonas sp. NFACC36]SFX39971.1 SagB-type dehydrogenase domain-containing protein [Pseudomonas sp. NFACC49-2]SIS10722.1 SagB-type dehydrogenase domain-containing protein [Pseudomonas sp. 7SR1]
MHINPCLFILARPPHQVVWNYERHTQFELELRYSTRLAQLIQDPSTFDINYPIDADLLDAEILIKEARTPTKWEWDELSRIFHIGTKNIPCADIPQDVNEWAALYLQHCNEVLASPMPSARISNPQADRIALARPLLTDLQDASLIQTLVGRSTSRSFRDQPISIEQVSTLLYLSLGYLNERRDIHGAAGPESLGARRSSPSGGGLNACEGYLYVRDVTGLAPGLYAYLPDEHALSLTASLPEAPLGRLLCGQHFINPLPFGLFITSRFDKLWWKYAHSRAYRMAFVETGHVSQTFLMVATALGLDTWLTGALSDREVERLLGLEDSCEQPLFFVGCGHGDGQVHCKELTALIERQDAVS